MTIENPSARSRPLVGLLYSSAAPVVIDAAGALVESLDIIPRATVLARRTACGVQLDLHNLYVNERNNDDS